VTLTTFCFITSAYAVKMRDRIIKYNLPEFCIYTQGWEDTDLNKYKKALKKYGFGWSHMHHYCVGLIDIQRAFSISGNIKKRNFELKQAISQFQYVLKNTGITFSLRPMVLTKQAYVFFLLNKLNEAFKNYQIAARLKRNYVPAYIGMADCYLKLGDKNGAVNILKIGLKYTPKSKILRKKISTLQSINLKTK
jgi:tetratricopeptide (TPR) repeat protein